MWYPGNKRTAIIAPVSAENFFQTEQFTKYLRLSVKFTHPKTLEENQHINILQPF